MEQDAFPSAKLRAPTSPAEHPQATGNNLVDNDLSGDTLPLDLVGIDDEMFTFAWRYRSGVDRLSLSSVGRSVAVVDGLESRRPQLLPDHGWRPWLAAELITAEAVRQWHHRGEIVADRALSCGGQI